ncbi:MAG TPA: hypothetical protein VGL11_23425 [Candidatus Binatia bacterium]|jgi:hypothetical protein
MEREKTFATTIGDLVIALTEETSQYVHDEKEACKVVAFMLTHLLNNSSAAARSRRYFN